MCKYRNKRCLYDFVILMHVFDGSSDKCFNRRMSETAQLKYNSTHTLFGSDEKQRCHLLKLEENRVFILKSFLVFCALTVQEVSEPVHSFYSHKFLATVAEQYQSVDYLQTFVSIILCCFCFVNIVSHKSFFSIDLTMLPRTVRFDSSFAGFRNCVVLQAVSFSHTHRSSSSSSSSCQGLGSYRELQFLERCVLKGGHGQCLGC